MEAANRGAADEGADAVSDVEGADAVPDVARAHRGAHDPRANHALSHRVSAAGRVEGTPGAR